MKIRLILILIIFFIFTVNFLYADTDPFYLKIFKEGKIQFEQHKYEDAIKDFKIAEFGLMEEKEVLAELYLYYSLAHFKLRHLDQAKNIINKFETELNVKDINDLRIPPSIERETKLMFFSLLKIREYKGDVIGTNKNFESVYNFEIIFQNTLENLEKNNLVAVKRGIKKLNGINKKDIRIKYLNGITYFKKKKYRSCIKVLRKIYGTIDPKFQDSVYFYLSVSFYFEKNYGQTLAFYYKIKDRYNRKKLDKTIKRVLVERSKAIDRVTENFSKKRLEELVEQYPGDQYICTDVLKSAMNKYKTSGKIIFDIINLSLTMPEAYNIEFILSAVLYLERGAKLNIAIRVIEKSKFFKIKNKKNIEIFYKLGQLYLDIYKLDKALKNMMLVKKFKKNYKKIDFYIDRINKLKYNER